MAKDLVTASEIMEIQKNVEVINNDITQSLRANTINGESLDNFIYQHFLNRIDPIEYCENVLRGHLPESRKRLHENQTALIRAVCNPKLKQVAGMMSRQCLAEEEIIHTRDGKLIKIKDYDESWITRKKTDVWAITAKYGFRLRCTHNHPIKTRTGWKKAGELTEGDEICCLYRWDKFGDGKFPYNFELNGKQYTGVFEMDDEFAYYFGKNSGKYLQYVNRDNIPKIEHLYEQLPQQVIEQYKKLNNITNFEPVFFNKMIVMKFLVNVTQFSKNEYLGWCINYFTKSQIIQFLKGVFEVNGRYEYVKKSKKLNGRIRCKTSIVYAEVLHELLNKIGIYSEVFSKGKGVAKRYHLKFDVHMYEDLMMIMMPQKILEKYKNIQWRKMPFSVEEIGEDGEELFYSPFVSRDYDGKEDTYDCEFPDKGWFVCGGIKTHNSGKCFAKGTKILMYDGTEKNVEDIQVGDDVMSPKGDAIKVTSLGRGEENMFEITPSTGISFTVNESHILSLKNSIGEVENITVRDFIKKKKKEQQSYYGYRVIMEYEPKKTKIDPYTLGYYLRSDGEYIPFTDISSTEISTLYQYMKMYNIKGAVKPKDINTFTVEWNEENVYDKYIPEEILFNTIDVRRKFLAGVIDSYWHEKTRRFVQDTKLILECKENRFVYDLIRLCNSIGISTKIEKRNCGCFLHLYGNFALLPLKDKKPCSRYNHLIFPFDIQAKGKGEYYGFTIDSKDHLFLLSDYTVVHNTESISSFSGFLIDNYPQMRVGIFTPRLQQAEVSIGRLSTFCQMNEQRLNNRIEKITKDRVELSNGSYVTAVSASDQSNIEGLTFDVIVLDEAQKVSDYTFSERILPMGGGCIVGTSSIQLLDGTIKTLKEIVEDGSTKQIPCIDFDTKKIVVGDITQFCDTGEQETIKLKLSNGSEICGTFDHPIIVKSRETGKHRVPRWERLDNVKIGYQVAIPRELPFFGNVHNNYARLLGMVIGDGCSSSTRNVQYSTEDSELIDYINTTGFSFHCHETHLTKKGNLFQQGNIVGGLQSVLRDVGIYGLTSLNKTLPKGFENWDKKSLAELISGLYDTDGTVHLEENRRCSIGFNSICKNIIDDVRFILRKFGIQTCIRKSDGEVKEYNCRQFITKDCWSIDIKDKESVENFYKNFKLLVPHKQNALEKGIEILKLRKNKIPKDLIETDMRFSRVVSIEYTGIQHVYDLTVDKYHSFIANNIFVHNTNAKIVQVGTPKTRNHFYDAIEGKAKDKWTVVKRDWTQTAQNWLLEAIYLPDPKTGKIRPYSRFIVETAMPKALKQEMFPNNPEIWTEGNLSIEDFRTQYMLEFIDGAGKFLTSEQIKSMTDGEYDWLDHGIIGETYVAGIDFAGSNPEGDNTQITVLRITRDGVKQKVFAKEFRDASYPEQMYYISNLFGGYKPRFECKKIFADYTGCGAAVVQTLQEEFGLKLIEGIIFNARDKYTNSGMNLKNAMYGKWRQELDNGKFKYPTKECFKNSNADGAGVDNMSYYHRMVGEWSDLEQTTTGFSVNKKIEAPSGYHDDVCDADVLANFAAVAGQRSHMPRPVSGRFRR